MDDVFDKLDDAQALLDARSLVYSLVARLFAGAPQEELLAVVRGDDLGYVCMVLTDGGGALASSLADWRRAAQATGAAQCRREYAALFESLAETVYPWESVHVCGEPLLFQPCTLDVRERYREEGFQAAGYPHDPDDHIASECGFMARLAERVAESCASGDEAACRAALAASSRFLDEHLGVWVENFAAAFEQQNVAPRDGFYACCARFAAAFVQADAAMLSRMRAQALPCL